MSFIQTMPNPRSAHISFYIAAKPKRIKMVLPTIIYIFLKILEYFMSWRTLKSHLWFKSYGHSALLFQPTATALHCLPDLYTGLWLLTTKNGLIQQTSKMCMIIFLKVPSERSGPGASYSCCTQFSTVSHSKVIGKTKKADQYFIK